MAVGDGFEAGVHSWIAFFPESTFGTMSLTGSADLQTAHPISIGIKTELNSQKLDQLSVNRGFEGRVQLDKTVGGALETYFHPEESLHFFVNAMGGTFTYTALTTASLFSVSSGQWQSAATITSLSLVAGKGQTNSWRYNGGVIGNLKLAAAVGEPAKLTCEFVFRDSSVSSTDSLSTHLSFSTLPPFTFVDGVYRYDASEASAGSSAANQPIQGFELEIDNGLETDAPARELGSRLLSGRPPGKRREVKLKVTQRYDTTTTFTKMIQATEGAVELRFLGTTISAEYQREVLIRLPRVVLKSGGEPEVKGPGIIQNDLEFDVLVSGPATTTSRDIGLTWRSGRTASI